MQLDDAISQNSPKLKPKKFKPLTEAAWEEIKKSVRDDPILSLGMDRAAFGSTYYKIMIVYGINLRTQHNRPQSCRTPVYRNI